MANDELERRVEILEQEVQVLTEALQSVLEWKFKPSGLRQRQTQFENLVISVEGHEQTKEILKPLT